ncbi:MAG: pirin family protein [Gammaproteobacteria bacterium]|jgi:redox-sensitive bicupin YhaK (pirin superfamily)|nr:pirin family protein [Gammaproteobacteria bacterium]MDH3847180.1 pirin family protein [Gammaproteobacteria bacterium]MDH3864235.1 pirin family protein [Gammaproteobacteria bacterium]MDH3905660.1 pirin family protein [Gammaproteobacteria bacterium]MDH3908011.1 pirin family protein [Gammaproteobacteria bacterium]
MIDVIRSDSRGTADHGWLKSKHTFSFADYHNPSMMGFGKLRVINEDWIEPGKGFGTHPHRDMEIVTYMVDGALEHKDSMGNGSVILPGELQRMTAGTGVLHSEFNASETDRAHLLQIWILPEQNGLEPGYEQKLFPAEEKRNRWRLVGSRDGRDGSLTIHQDISLSSTVLDAGESIGYAFDGRRRGFLQVVRGTVEIDGETIETGDAIAVVDQQALDIKAKSDAELLLFDMV